MIGSTMAKLWADAGHDVRLASRHPDDLSPLVRQTWHPRIGGNGADAAGFGEVVMITVPLKAIPSLAADLAPHLAGKVVLDTGNAYEQRDGQTARDASRASREASAAWAAQLLPGRSTGSRRSTRSTSRCSKPKPIGRATASGSRWLPTTRGDGRRRGTGSRCRVRPRSGRAAGPRKGIRARNAALQHGQKRKRAADLVRGRLDRLNLRQPLRCAICRSRRYAREPSRTGEASLAAAYISIALATSALAYLARSENLTDPIPEVPRQQQRTVDRSEFRWQWPFTVGTGTLGCVDGAIVFRSAGTNYALNPWRGRGALPPTNPSGRSAARTAEQSTPPPYGRLIASGSSRSRSHASELRVQT